VVIPNPAVECNQFTFQPLASSRAKEKRAAVGRNVGLSNFKRSTNGISGQPAPEKEIDLVVMKIHGIRQTHLMLIDKHLANRPVFGLRESRQKHRGQNRNDRDTTRILSK